MFPEWVFGILFRPGVTYEKADRELRLGYFWILLSVLTLEVVMSLYAPWPPEIRPHTLSGALFSVSLILMILFDVQVFLFLGVARLFQWRLQMVEASRWIGLGWSLILVQDVITFYPTLSGQFILSYWLGVPFFLWYLAALIAGVRRVTAMPSWQATVFVLLASIPWQGLLLWLNWSGL